MLFLLIVQRRELGKKCPKMLITFRGQKELPLGLTYLSLRKLESTSLHSKAWALAFCESNVYMRSRGLSSTIVLLSQTHCDQVVDITKDLATVSVGLFSLWVYTKSHS